MMSVLVLPVLLVGLAPGLFNLLLLFLDQESLHRIVIVMFLHEQRQFSLLGKHRPSLLLLATLVFRQSLSLSLHHVLPADLELFWVFIVSSLVPRMIHTDEATTNFCST